MSLNTNLLISRRKISPFCGFLGAFHIFARLVDRNSENWVSESKSKYLIQGSAFTQIWKQKIPKIGQN